MVISDFSPNPNEPESGNAPATTDAALTFTDGSLCFDFANTLDARRAAHPGESLSNYSNLVGWASRTGIVRPEQAKDLLARADADPDAAAQALRRATALREAIYRAFEAIAAAESANPADLDVIRSAFAHATVVARLAPAGGRFIWEWSETGSLDWLLGPVAQSAVELLLSDNLARVRTCDADGCGWIFLDTTKNASRRWCSMASCGSRMKMRRQYARKKAGRAT